MYIDFTDLNKACPKDSYPLSITSSHELLIFIDTFFSYNQIQMALKNTKNITFIIDREVYRYRVIPFGLKNVDMTYQCM